MNKATGEDKDYDWDHQITWFSYHPQRIGCKVSRVFFSTDCHADRLIFPMDEKPAREAVLQTFQAVNTIYGATNPKSILFYVHMDSVVSNFGHKILDSTWKEHLWASSIDQQFTDFKFLVGNESFSAHRSLLSARSPVFAAMFRSGKLESQTGEVRLDDVEPSIFRWFLKFMFTGTGQTEEIRLDDVDPSTFRRFLYFLYTGTLESFIDKEELLPLAYKYQVKTLANLCQLATTFNIEDFVGHVLVDECRLIDLF